ncbi:MAG: hypothetical protein ABR985_02575 [Methanotrichaceae archaeon]|jgi:hypothetical protein
MVEDTKTNKVVHNPELVIDPEFESLIPQMTAEEERILEELLIRDGCKPLDVWDLDGKLILLDGHHRYKICNRLNIQFEVELVDIQNRNDAIVWIILTTLGRRNISDAVKVELALRLKPLLAIQAKERMLAGVKIDPKPNLADGMSNGTGQVRDEIAKIAGVSHGTADKVEAVLESGSDSLKDAMRTEKVSINAAHAIASLPQTEQDEIVSGGKPAIKEATKKIKAAKKKTKTELNTKEEPEIEDIRITRFREMLEITDSGYEGDDCIENNLICRIDLVNIVDGNDLGSIQYDPYEDEDHTYQWDMPCYQKFGYERSAGLAINELLKSRVECEAEEVDCSNCPYSGSREKIATDTAADTDKSAPVSENTEPEKTPVVNEDLYNEWKIADKKSEISSKGMEKIIKKAVHEGVKAVENREKWYDKVGRTCSIMQEESTLTSAEAEAAASAEPEHRTRKPKSNEEKFEDLLKKFNLTEVQVEEFVKMHKNGMAYVDIAKEMNLPSGSIVSKLEDAFLCTRTP